MINNLTDIIPDYPLVQILIGSQALNCHFKDCKKFSDIDIATLGFKHSEIYNGNKIEIKPIPALFNYPREVDRSNKIGIASINMIYTLKCSHLSWDIHWNKTALDIIWFQQNTQAKLIPSLYEELYKYWEVIHKSKKHIKLNIPNQEFFDNNINYTIEHDKLHQKYKFYDTPLFEQCKIDKSQALLSKTIFDSWDKDKQLQLALEEINVIAEERFKFSQKAAIKHLILSMTKGWFNTFLINNLNNLLEKFDKNKNFLNNTNIIKKNN